VCNKMPEKTYQKDDLQWTHPKKRDWASNKRPNHTKRFKTQSTQSLDVGGGGTTPPPPVEKLGSVGGRGKKQSLETEKSGESGRLRKSGKRRGRLERRKRLKKP